MMHIPKQRLSCALIKIWTAVGLMALALAGCSDSGGPDGIVDAGTEDASGPRPLTWQPEQRLTDDPADSYTTYNFSRNIAADDTGRVHAVFYDSREGPDHVYYLRSLDGGETWTAVQRLSDVTIGGEHPSIAVSGDSIYVGWHDEFDDQVGPKPRILVRRSVDGGETWEPAFVLADRPEGAAHCSVAAAGDHVHVAWTDQRSGNSEIYLRSSYDRGATWEAEQRISSEPYIGWVPTVEADGDLVLVGWVDYRDANEEEYLRRSIDAGLTFGPEIRLTDDPHDSWAPSIAIQGDTVHFFWFDRRDCGLTDSEVEAEIDEVMTFMGLTPEAAPPRDPANYYLHEFLARVARKHDEIVAEVPAFEAGGGDMARLQELLDEFYTAMEQWNNGWEIYHKRSEDRGVTFGPDTRLTFTDEHSMRPSVAVLGDEVHVAWFDGRNGGNLEIYYRRSPDRGLTWEDETRITDAPEASMHVSLAAASSGVHLLWYDERYGNPEIYYRRATY